MILREFREFRVVNFYHYVALLAKYISNLVDSYFEITKKYKINFKFKFKNKFDNNCFLLFINQNIDCVVQAINIYHSVIINCYLLHLYTQRHFSL